MTSQLLLILAAVGVRSFVVFRGDSGRAPSSCRLQLCPLVRGSSADQNDAPLALPLTIPSSVTDRWSFSLLERRDLNEAAQLSMESFYTPRLALDTTGATGLELRFLEWLKNSFNNMDRSDAYNGNYLGFRSRSGSRLVKPSLVPSLDSFILVAKKMETSAAQASDDVKIAGLVEICLEVADGKLAPPIQFPWKGSLTGKEHPYLCNLCVDKSLRRQGLGQILVAVAEQLVLEYWGKRSMYLHVENKNIAAQELYSKMNYTLVLGGVSSIAYNTEHSAASLDEDDEIAYGSLTKYDDIFYYRKKLIPQWSLL